MHSLLRSLVNPHTKRLGFNGVEARPMMSAIDESEDHRNSWTGGQLMTDTVEKVENRNQQYRPEAEVHLRDS
jgi:hypothetical protein